MDTSWIILVPLLPLLAAVTIGGLHFMQVITGEADEGISAWISIAAIGLSNLALLTLLAAAWLGAPAAPHVFGHWLHTSQISIAFSLSSELFSFAIAAVFAMLFLIVTQFSVNYLHREAGFHRFFFILNLFAAAMMLLVLSGNAVFTFVGWEVAGVCSYWLIAYAYDRPVAAHNAARVFVTNRVGDAGFLLGIVLAMLWLDCADWHAINNGSLELAQGDVNVLALCFVLAAFAKSAQIPFTPWLARALEGPTPSSAIFYGGVMIHAGVFLLLQLQSLLTQAPLVMGLIALMGGLTTLYSYWVGLSQTDIKSSQAYAAAAQLGLMFVECGLGFWQLAAWHMAAHAVVRCYLLLTAPSILHVTHGRAIAPLSPRWAKCRWAFLASLQRGWLELALDWLLVRPIQQFARDMRTIEDRIIDPVLGVPAPAINAVSSLAAWEERKIGANLASDEDSFAQGSGLAGKLAQWTAAMMSWFEYHFILRGIGRHSIRLGRRLGRAANRFEQLLLSPRYLILFVLITLMVALEYAP